MFRDFLDVGHCFIMAKHYDILFVSVKSMFHGTFFVIVVKEASVMLTEFIFVIS